MSTVLCIVQCGGLCGEAIQESRVAAHAALEEDADLESLIINISTQTEASDMVGIPVHDGRAGDECARCPRLPLGRVRQISARHAAVDSTVRCRCLPWIELYELK